MLSLTKLFSIISYNGNKVTQHLQGMSVVARNNAAQNYEIRQTVTRGAQLQAGW